MPATYADLTAEQLLAAQLFAIPCIYRYVFISSETLYLNFLVLGLSDQP